MKTFKLMIATAIALFAVVGCSKDTTEDALTMGTTEISVPAAGSTQPLTFTANTSWTVSSDQDWVTFDRMSGDAGEATVNMTVDANPDYENRTATVTIKAGTKTTLFKVVQKMLETFSAEFVYEIGPEEQTIEFATESNKEYEFLIDEESASWISFAPTQSSAPESSVVRFAVSANTSVSPREGRIVAKVGDVAYALIVKQNADFEYMTAAAATCYGRTMKIYDGTYYKYNEYGIELTNEEGVKVVLAINAARSENYLSELPVGTYTVDASASHTPGTFAIKTLDSSESVYTTIFEGETETTVADGEISVAKEGNTYTILASLMDSRENVLRYSFVGEIPTIEDKSLGGYFYKFNSEGQYDTYFTSKANMWSLIVLVSKELSSDAKSFPAAYIGFDIYGDSSTELPTGTFTFMTGKQDSEIPYANGNWNYKTGDATSGSVYDEYDDEGNNRGCDVKDGSTITISKNADGTYKFEFDMDLTHDVLDDNWEVVATEEYTYEGVVDNVEVRSEIGKSKLDPVPDGDIVAVSAGSMSGLYWGDKAVFDALDPAPSFTVPNNSLLTASFTGLANLNSMHSLNVTLYAPWVWETNYANRFCNTPIPDGTYTFSYTPAENAIVPVLYGSNNSYTIFTNGYTGTKCMIVGGSMTFADGNITFDLKVAPYTTQDGQIILDPDKEYSITGMVPNTVQFFQNFTSRAGSVKFWTNPSGNSGN